MAEQAPTPLALGTQARLGRNIAVIAPVNGKDSQPGGMYAVANTYGIAGASNASFKQSEGKGLDKQVCLLRRESQKGIEGNAICDWLVLSNL